MIDRVKLQILFVTDELIISKPHIFTDMQITEAGDNFNFTFENFRCKYLAKNNSVEVMGSLHKFQMGNNYCDFSLEDVYNAFARLAMAFDVPLKSIIIYSIEIGVNLIMPK